MREYIITDKQLKTATEAYLEHELSRPITAVFISGDKLPEIVRCRECEHRYDNQCCRNPGWFDIELGGFCAWGERRTDDN